MGNKMRIVGAAVLLGLAVALHVWVGSGGAQGPAAQAAAASQNEAYWGEPHAASQAAPAPRPPVHNYVMRNGGMYGYERAISEAERKAGLQVVPLQMFGYAGERDGMHMVFQTHGASGVVAAHCEDPCSFMKVMTFSRSKYLRTELIRFERRSLLGAAMDDALRGRLERYVDNRNPKRPLHVWCSERKGCTGEPIKR